MRGGVAERERILQVARGARLPQVRAGSSSRMRALRRAMPGIRPGQGDRRVEGRGVGREGLPVERGGDRERVEQAHGVGQRERRQARAEGVVVDQRDALLGGQGHVAADAVGEVGQRAEIALARRAEQAHARRLAGVEGVDDARRAAPVRTPEVPLAKPFASRSMAARTTSRGASGPAAMRWSRSRRRL